uniref:Mutator-like transposase domain-containing protein n=1 Tax=Timema douglasi TaxID=61478 RepID=A0A7R8VT00_TIMDO|nr:unnamed protein product [Timema douglasi]
MMALMEVPIMDKKKWRRHEQRIEVACIIRAATNGLLYIGVKNKYCYICSQSEPGKESKEHKCYKNYQGTSTGIEQAILVQGFRESARMHNLRYKYIVSDGDSSTYAKIQHNVTYGRQVIKLECANHMVRNYTDKLHKIIRDTVHDITARKELSQLIPRLTKGARAAITDAGDNVSNSDVLRDGLYHVFGQHSNCKHDQLLDGFYFII